MITPKPQVLRILLSRYAEARIMQFESDTAENRHRLDDMTHALCVTTGVHTIEHALALADDLLQEQRRSAEAPGTGRPDTDRAFPAPAA
ncbi:DUF5133 domain-containing protein [Streptomyces sp. MBT65]|uniref:DUF5133 domain-containing protein n=1 Tax=Streptomyces sp. MBT65 TaxID=1488395 RepID=UPI00190AADD0|nr:DUF5133 domain-containing protein [Streptomyces sp. MBT65]MBK3575644.1 DUF5133 domain-containing protein [Streptomyces sp. MBT65]